MMRKSILFVTVCLVTCLTQSIKAYEVEFDMSQALTENTSTESNKILLKQTTQGGKTVYFEIKSPDNSVDLSRCYIDNNRLAVPAGVQFTFRCTEKLNEIWLGTMPSNSGNTDYYFGNEVNSILDYAGVGGTDNVFIAGRSNLFNAGTSNFSATIQKYSSNDQSMYFVGPVVKVHTEPISTEDLTFADHNVIGQYHSLNDELVGVDVVEVGPSWNKVSYLICRSASPISDAHKHAQGGQELLKDASGNIPAYANPATIQYSWIGLKIENPESYVGKQFKGVRGQYVPDGVNGTDEYYNYKMFNPIMQVVGTPTVVAENVQTVINTYTVANLEEQDNKQYFFMEPRPFEIANIIDVMRTNNQGIKTPSRAAIMPNGKTENIYVDNNITGFAAIIDPQYDVWKDGDMELFGVSTEWEAQTLAWRCLNKVYDIPNALIFFATFDNNENPLDIPNRDYYQWASDKSLGIHIQGRAEIREYEEDMIVGDGDYWSRYEYSKNKNSYRNDLEINIYNPTTDFSKIGNLMVVRCDNEGNALATIATLEQNKYNNTKFNVTYADATQTATSDSELAKISKAPYTAQEFDIKESAIGISDMFYSQEINSRNANEALYSGYQYRVVPTEDNPNKNLTCVVSFAPVYKTNENVVTRATYTMEDVEADVDNSLEENNLAEITFTPNLNKDMTQYNIYRAQQGSLQGGKFLNITANEISVDDNGFLNPNIEDEITEGTSMEYVPELFTAYNNNTYGCYKQTISDANVSLNCSNMEVSTYVMSDGSRYCHAVLRLETNIGNIDKDSRYLVRVWREHDGTTTLLNTQSEGWETNYSDLDLQGMNDVADFNKTGNIVFDIHDTFIAKPLAANGINTMAQDEYVEIEDVNYYATLYVLDDASGKFYVKKDMIEPSNSVPTAVNTINGVAQQVESVRYYNAAGIESDKPFTGINIVVTRFSDGTTTTSKAIK